MHGVSQLPLLGFPIDPFDLQTCQVSQMRKMQLALLMRYQRRQEQMSEATFLDPEKWLADSSQVFFTISIYFHHSFDHLNVRLLEIPTCQDSKNHFLAAYLTGDLEVLDFCLQVDYSAFCTSTKWWKMPRRCWILDGFPGKCWQAWSTLLHRHCAGDHRIQLAVVQSWWSSISSWNIFNISVNFRAQRLKDGLWDPQSDCSFKVLSARSMERSPLMSGSACFMLRAWRRSWRTWAVAATCPNGLHTRMQKRDQLIMTLQTQRRSDMGPYSALKSSH